MTPEQADKLLREVSRKYKLECKFPLQVFGSSDLGCRFRDAQNAKDGMIAKATFAVSLQDTEEYLRAKAITAADCLRYGVQSGWNRAEQSTVLDLKAS